MEILNKIKNYFIDKGCSIHHQEESFESYTLNLKINNQISIDNAILYDIFVDENLGNITLKCKNNDTEDFSECSSSNPETIESFLKEIPDNPSDIIFTISKKHTLNKLDIICSDTFAKFLESNDPLLSLMRISELIKNNEPLTITVSGEVVNRNENKCFKQLDRNELINNRNEGCNFENAYNVTLTPNDFYIINSKNAKLYFIFNCFKNALSAIFLMNYSKIDSKNIVGTLCGLKKKEKQSQLLWDFDDANELFNIYEWVYNNRSFTESIEIARNIMSLHFVENNIFKYNTDTLISIKSNYNLISKQCTKDYLETKQQIENQIITTNKAIREIINSYQSQLTSLIFILLTLLFTVIISGVISGKKQEIFTIDILLVFWMFLLIFILTFIFRTIGECLSIKKLREDHFGFLDRYDHLIDNGEMNLYMNKAEEIKFKFWTLNRMFWLMLIALMFTLLILKTPVNFLELI